MIHSTVNAKGEFVITDDDGKKMTKKALRQQSRERRDSERRHPMGLYVTADDDGTRHFWRGDNEISEDDWMQQHPHMKGKYSGRDGNSDSGQQPVGGTEQGASQGNPQGSEDQQRKTIRQQRQQDRQRSAESRSAGQAESQLGQDSGTTD